MAPRKIIENYARWRVHVPDLGTPRAYVEIEATQLVLRWGKDGRHVIPFDTLEISEATGVILARRNLCVVANLTRA
jgi:uncharacterized protein YqjF (DUF2071 family)